MLSKVLNDGFCQAEIDHSQAWRLIVRCNSRIPEGLSSFSYKRERLSPALVHLCLYGFWQRNRQLLRAGLNILSPRALECLLLVVKCNYGSSFVQVKHF